MEDRKIFVIRGKPWWILYREAVTVEELIELGRELDCIE